MWQCLPEPLWCFLDNSLTPHPVALRSLMDSLSPPCVLSQSTKNSYSSLVFFAGRDSIWIRFTLCTYNIKLTYMRIFSSFGWKTSRIVYKTDFETYCLFWSPLKTLVCYDLLRVFIDKTAVVRTFTFTYTSSDKTSSFSWVNRFQILKQQLRKLMYRNARVVS